MTGCWVPANGLVGRRPEAKARSKTVVMSRNCSDIASLQVRTSPPSCCAWCHADAAFDAIVLAFERFVADFCETSRGPKQVRHDGMTGLMEASDDWILAHGSI
jgi:hypothetical protein